MKTLSYVFILLFGLNFTACSREDEVDDIQREEEYDVNDIRERELDLDN